MQNLSKKKLILLVISFSIIIMVILYTVIENKHISEVRQRLENDKQQAVITEMNKTPTTSDLKINSSTSNIDGDYIYINGSVSNMSSHKAIKYFEVGIKFYDIGGKVIDSDYTNDGIKLSPGETRKFEIMHKYDKSMTTFSLFIQDVS
ncbi:MAG: FxLYD domain-containing protein [Anaerovoracaceae bacterium]